MDNLHLKFTSLNWVKWNLRRFVNEKMTDQDMIAILTSDGVAGIASQFTRERKILRYAIEQISYVPPIPGSGYFTPYLASRVQCNDRDAMNLTIVILCLQEGICIPSLSAMEAQARMRSEQILQRASYSRKATLDSLEVLAGQTVNLPGQRAITIISDGFTLLDKSG